MGLYKDKLVFDPTSAATIAASDQVGSYLFDAAGDLITSTLVGSDQALDVYVAGGASIDVALDGFYHVTNNPTPDTVGNVFAKRAASIGVDDLVNYVTSGAPNTDDVDPSQVVALDTTSYLHAWDGSAWDRLTVSADGLNINVNNSSDIGVQVNNEVDVNLQDGSGNDISSTGGALDINIASVGAVSFDVDLNDLQTDDAAHTGDGLAIGVRCEDGLLTAVSADQDFGLATADMYRRMYINDAPNIGVTLSKPTITDTAAEIAGTPQAGRTRILVQNLSNLDIYVGPSNAVTTSTGIRVAKGSLLELPWGEDLDLYAISSTGISSDVRVLEVA